MIQQINLTNNAKKVLLVMLLLKKDGKKEVAFNDLAKQERNKVNGTISNNLFKKEKKKKIFTVNGLNPNIVNKGLRELEDFDFIPPVDKRFILNNKPSFKKAFEWIQNFYRDYDSLEKISKLPLLNPKQKIKINPKGKERELLEKYLRITIPSEIELNAKEQFARQLGKFFEKEPKRKKRVKERFEEDFKNFKKNIPSRHPKYTKSQ
jgi:hypothetical protein